MAGRLGVRLRAFVDGVGIDPWDIDPESVRAFLRAYESEPESRYWFGSPCRFVRRIDLWVHVYLPEMVAERHPVWACYLRTTSPRWGRAWRGWGEGSHSHTFSNNGLTDAGGAYTLEA